MTILGNKPSSAPGSTHAVAANTQIATPRGNAGGVFASQIIQAPENGWLTAIGAWAQKVSGTPQVYFAAWSNKGGNVPDRLLGRTGLRTISTAAANNESNVSVAGGLTASAIRVTSGQILQLGLTLQGGAITVGKTTAVPPITPTFPIYHRAVAAGALTDPFTPDGSVTTGLLAVYAEFVENSPPNAPTGLTPANGASTNDSTPTLGGTFSDPDTAAPTLDKLWAYEFEVRDNADETLLWGGKTALFIANAGEQDSGSWARPYNGTPLSGGQAIKWRTRAYDLSGTPGAWSAYRTLTLDANANVTMTAPTGKVDGPTEEIGWAGTYHDPAAVPASLGSNLALWLKADAITGLSDNDPVASWTDSSGNARHATQGTAGSRPTYQTNELNGLPVVRFDGVDDNLDTPTFSLSQPYTVVMLAKDISITGNDGYWAKSTHILRQNISGTDHPQFQIAGGGNVDFTTTSIEGLTWHTSILSMDGNSTALRWDGAAASGTPSGTLTSNPTAGGFRVGVSNTTAYTNIDVAEALVFDRLLTLTEAQQVEGYMNHKWGLEANLPVDHPYKSFNPSASTHMQVRVLKDSLIYREGEEFSKVVASSALPGTAFTVSANDDGDVGFLGQGLALAAQMRAKANDIWGDWSPPLSFSTNALPTIPTLLQPPSGSTSTSRPLLTWRSSDADDEEGTEVTWEVEITRPDGQVDVYAATAWNATAGEGSLQTTATHLPASDPLPYSWRVRANDVSASDGLSEWSDPATFTYSAGIVVTITDPTEGEIVTESSPTVTFTISAGTLTQRRLVIYLKDTTTPKYDSGVQASSSGVFTIPAGVLLNGNSYDLTVFAVNDSAAEGTSARRQIAVGFAAPDGVVAPECSPYQFAGDPEPTAVLFSWSPAQLPLSSFRGYAVRRRRSGEDLKDATLLKIISGIAQSRWLDTNAPADGPHVYSASVLRKVGSQTVESVAAEAEIDLDLRVVVISAASGNTGQRAVLRWKPSTRRGSYAQQGEDYPTWGTAGKPTAVFGQGTQRVIDGTFTLVSDEVAEREQHFRALEELYLAGVPVIYRDERTRFFGRIQTFTYDMADNTDLVSLKIGEIFYTEGASVSGSDGNDGGPGESD